MSDSHHAVDTHHVDIDKHVRTYILVFVSLMVLTVATVGVYYIHMSPAVGIAVALFIASIKAGLVACFFMHLIDEKKLIYWVLGLTMFLFFVLLFTGMMARAAHQVLPT
ncbi:MAG TPA: cytochrome C oxidase subunit IV family protein [Thermoanaerobaculia bacterium]|nr:cytochrome C oxidase subunit IV family protein [Thermoanaerobaculia bacterium]